MPVKRSRQTKEVARAANHPYKLRSFRNSSQDNIARDRPAEKLKQQKALRERTLQVLDRKELRKFPVAQLRRLAVIKKVNGRRKQSIMLSLRRIYGDDVPLYPSEGRVEMREYSREEYQIGRKKVIKVDAYQEIVVKNEMFEDTSILKDAPCLRRSSRLKERVQPAALSVLVKPSSKTRCRQG